MSILTPGSIAFTSFNADGGNGFSFVAVDGITAGTTIGFTTRAWDGDSFTPNGITLTWTATADVPAGQLVEISGLDKDAAAAITSSSGTIAGNQSGAGLVNQQDVLYAFTGTTSAPETFLAAVANDGFDPGKGVLEGTGLAEGETAVNLGTGVTSQSPDNASYDPEKGGIDFGTDREALLNAVNNPANWVSQNAGVEQDQDGITPDAPALTDPESPLAGVNFTICFCAGTAIATPDGPRAVETLAAGDLVLTADGAAQPIRWIGRQTIATRFADPLRDLPVRIAAGALGEGLPARDLRLSPCHALQLDGVLAEAGALVNGTTVVREAAAAQPERFTYFHVELADHALILAEGVPAETFVDNVSRRNFDNWAEHEALPAGAPMVELDLPRVASARQLPAALRRRLEAARAA